jgi:exodeoxyribonuclease V
MKWSPQQSDALSKVARWLREPGSQVFYLAGFAGTGKTTIARHLVEGTNCVQAAFTGKAASVLRSKGFPNASTLHSLLYSVSEKSRERLEELLIEKKKHETPPRELLEEIREEKKRLRSPNFLINPDSVIRDVDLVLVDEGSMVSKELGSDLLSFGKKVLVMGDPAQLPPVMGAGFFTSRRPDHQLTEIHRQALESPIIRWSMKIREGASLPFGKEEGARKVRKNEITSRDLLSAGQILTGKNVTRRNINRKLRTLLGRMDMFPEEGDKLVCLRNSKDDGVLNGVLCEAIANTIGEDDWYGLKVRYEGRDLDVLLDPAPFLAYQNPEEGEGLLDRSLLQFDYGYALTVHKSQGSQWSDVWVADDGFAKWDAGLRKKWLYTAVTRAEHTLTIVV